MRAGTHALLNLNARDQRPPPLALSLSFSLSFSYSLSFTLPMPQRPGPTAWPGRPVTGRRAARPRRQGDEILAVDGRDVTGGGTDLSAVKGLIAGPVRTGRAIRGG